MNDKCALLVMDFVNEIVHARGKYAREGYMAEVTDRQILGNTARLIDWARGRSIPVVYVIVGFSPTYIEWPEVSPVFRHAKDDKRIVLGTWSTEVVAELAPRQGDIVITKHRISPFYQTNLDLILSSLKIETLLLTGVSTEFVVLSAARDAHDRDYNVVVFSDATAASSQARHLGALEVISRTARITTVDEMIAGSIQTRVANDALVESVL